MSERVYAEAELAAASARALDLDMSTLPEDDKTELPPAGAAKSSTVVMSVRVPFALFERLKSEAESQGIAPSTLMRQYAEAGLAEAADDTPISRAEVVRMIRMLRPAA
jgi:hypothetical protein